MPEYHATAHPRGCTRPHRLVRAWCVCWGVVPVVDWEIGTGCSRCGETFITEAEHLAAKDTAAEPLGPKPQRASIVRDGRLRPTTTVTTKGRL